MANEREKIIRYYRASGDADLAAKLLDTAEAALRYHKYKITDFLDPYGYTIAETIAAHFERLQLDANGGYVSAERVKASFTDEDFMGDVDYGIGAIRMEFDPRYYQLSHRDVLGALTGLGLKREIIGDIIMLPDGCQVVIDSSMIPFVLQNLDKIGAAPAKSILLPLEELVAKEERIKEIRTTVASMRLDVIAAAGFGVSRSKMASDIAADKLKVNWQEAKNSAQNVKQGDIISMRGRGRVEISEIIGQTKKGRTSVILKRFL
ncbi:RNA-binding protein [Anaerosporomusa subterranea]|uniref:RNA-binding protein n=1 Tax=Anaerosporomusa subterranea TaxID=1794912 RepID=A0A154BT99_ANASB|nr:YlmH/Sll1252 family protein [Anaerosporomusa subterranea]KYZ77233.1 RNA-binding protein [Anaerosporomusa subterranea]